ncbi:amino acid permease [Scandinavium sp. V105_16]|uniref:Amino acid permease n=1 Tax=Scandinavium lactucae TaxID=3095028 RepID=A0AAJ2VSJ1_9ENTR|nr:MULTISPECIES: amino acid permease [unclassified Scandinavium]MDX6020488.1 amino acid permease [Scandinavium sp. V105_16]MDX6031960.1 amino acid permease [Scandinavium sp. V105_12]MDX6039842.1 amino acid permease [Scandinavium sp. V105_6]MDX6051425.1 amino acid permease [Scandinavium sp. V105_1]
MSKLWSKDETLWSFALYGTAVGAGTLFLPIQLGSAGAMVLLVTALVAWPLTYWPHRALCRFILSANLPANVGITGAVNHYYGKKIGNLITALYFIAFFVVVLIYAVAITNSLTEQLAKQMTVTLGVRMLVSLAVVLVLNLIFLMGRHATLKVMGFLVFPLIAYFLFLSLYLTSSWEPARFSGQLSFTPQTLHQIWLSIPVMVFAFSHTPIISTFAIDRREKFGDAAMDKCKKIMRIAYLIICLSVLFFVFSCLLAIPEGYITHAKNEGVTILSALAMMPAAPHWLAVSGIIVAIVAMSKSFLGTYFGVIEGASEMVRTTLNQVGVRKSRAFNRATSILLVSAVTFAVCCINPNAISMIYAISGPLIAMILFIMPTLSTYAIPALKPYRSVGSLLTLIVGLLCVSVMFFG